MLRFLDSCYWNLTWLLLLFSVRLLYGLILMLACCFNFLAFLFILFRFLRHLLVGIVSRWRLLALCCGRYPSLRVLRISFILLFWNDLICHQSHELQCWLYLRNWHRTSFLLLHQGRCQDWDVGFQLRSFWYWQGAYQWVQLLRVNLFVLQQFFFWVLQQL